ncbi:BamA/TamA family outer membrane protein [Olivibacter domesticus]|uniref:Surface antigen n=1 Tax=Olivibacter domesticus TaxID=407022 RepID=A0A1H7I1C1_OLID1|nr:BamA/TamA family outer membrane protein [Olivibacter domesticus]SEK56174.1 Surface antigen [Olivibacter domesticus]
MLKRLFYLFLFFFNILVVNGQQSAALQEVINPIFPISVNELPDRLLFQNTHNKVIISEFTLPKRGLGGLLLFSPDGKFCISSGNDSRTTVYSVDQASIKQIVDLPFRSVFAVFNPSAEEVLLVHSPSVFKQKLSRYSIHTWEPIHTRNIASDINSVGISSDGQTIGFSNNRLIQLLDYHSFEKKEVNWQKEKQRLLVFNPRKQELASVTDGNIIQIRNLSDEVLEEVKADQAKVVWLSYDRFGDHLLSLDEIGNLYVWNVDQKKLTSKFDQIYLRPSFNEKNELLLKQDNEWHSLSLLQEEASLVEAPYFEKNKESRFKILPKPILGYTRETGLILGAATTMIWYPKSNDSSKFSQPTVFVPAVSYGFNGKQLSIGGSMEAYYKHKWYFANTLSFTNNNKNYFFGVGKESEREHKTAYVSDNIVLDGSVSRILSDRFFIGLGYKLRKDSKLSFERDPMLAFNGGAGGWLFGIGPVLRMDKRDNIIFPSKGSWLEINYYRFNKDLISDYQYHEIKFDYRKYFPVNWLIKGDVLAVQAMFNGTWGGDVPFYQLPYMTADKAFRGVWRNLYIADQVYSVQAEYRSYFSEVDPRFGYAVFAGLGDDAKNFFKDYAASIKAFYGVGFRQQLVPKFRLDSRVDFGLTSKGDFGIFVGTGVAF